MTSSMEAFLLICLLLTLSPGADTALILKSAMGRRRNGFVFTTAGICAGLGLHALMSSLGLSAILAKSAQLYLVVKFVGAGYLIYLGLRGLHKAFFGLRNDMENISTLSKMKDSGFAEFRTGLLTNILNPKVAVFYLTFLPQFVNVQENIVLQSAGLAAIHIAMSFVWLCFIGYFVSFFKSQFEKPSVRQKMEAITGLALLGFGIRLTLSKD